MQQKRNGFTLIELLVVMSIIALLLALSAFGIVGARESTRDAQRKADLETIRSALEFYRADCNKYPTLVTAASFYGTYGSSFEGSDGGCSATSTYLSKVPQDPKGRNYMYQTNASGLTYTLCAGLETVTSQDSTNCGTTSCGSGINCSYGVTNP